MELIIFSVVMVVSVLAHYFFWRSSKKRYSECIKLTEAINKKLKQLETSNEEMDIIIDEAEEAIDRIDEGIEDLRSWRFTSVKKPTFDN